MNFPFVKVKFLRVCGARDFTAVSYGPRASRHGITRNNNKDSRLKKVGRPVAVSMVGVARKLFFSNRCGTKKAHARPSWRACTRNRVRLKLQA